MIWKITAFLFPLSIAARSMGLLCAREGQAADRCRAHLTFFCFLLTLDYDLENYCISFPT